MKPYYLLLFAPLLLVGCTNAAPPRPDFANLPAYLTALNRSTDPEAKLIRRQIADGPADLARERTAAEKEGILTRPAELQPPPPPADQNAAPLYLQLDALRKQKPLYLPLYAQPLNGRYAYTPEQIAAVQKEYDARQDIFTLLHQATDKPQCVFVHDRSQGFYVSFPEYTGLRESAREINTESLLQVYQGNFPAALADDKRGFRIADHVASDPRLMPFLVGSAIEMITLDGMQTILKKAGPNAALDTDAEQAILARQSHTGFFTLSHALRGEPAVDDAEFSRLHQSTPADLAKVFFRKGSLFSGKRTASSSARFTPEEQIQVGLLIDAAEADYLHQMRRIVAAADLPTAGRQAVFDQVEARALANKNDPIEAISDQLNPLVSWDATMAFMHDTISIDQPFNRLFARRLVAAAGAAVLATKAQTGAFPDTLPPTFTDPFTGKPLGYRREGDNGFVVYSAGPDGKFDGGKPGDTRSGANIVFRYPLVTLPIPQDMLK